MALLCAAAGVLAACGEHAGVSGSARPLALYAFPDEVGERTLPQFERRSGIRVALDPIVDNPTLLTKLLVAGSGYDVVMPTSNFLQPLIAAGALRKLDRSKLANWRHLDPEILARLSETDPANQYAVPYVWGTIGIGLNVGRATRALGYAPPRSVRLLFDPEVAKRLSSCGIAWPDAGGWVMAAWASIALGRDPSTQRVEDLPAIEAALMRVRPYVKYIDSLKVDSDLANGEVCIGVGPSGGLLQARDVGSSTQGGATFEYVLPVEGGLLWVDVLAIPADAPDVEGAHRLIDYLIDPAVSADVTNTTKAANANRSATGLVEESIRTDPGIYPPESVRRALHAVPPETSEFGRERVRMWARVRDGVRARR